MRDDVQRLRERTKRFAIRVIRLCGALPRARAADVIGRQLLRSGTSVGAQYREACRSRSNAELISKFESVLQELDETSYWLELLIEADLVAAERLQPLLDETDELMAMIVASVKSVKRRR